jgi:acyl-coenzyme A thioesterase PaaI-like protein
MKPSLLKLRVNIYPPYWGTGVAVQRISPDFREINVRMKLHWYNRNWFGNHFGGSLYAMTDPFYALMLIHNLGTKYVVTDKAGAIDYVRPGTGTLTARFLIDDALLEDIRVNTRNGSSYLPQLAVEITDGQQKTVARVVKTIYVRRKKTPV